MRKMMAPLVAANDVKALAGLWRGYRTLIVQDNTLASVPVPMMVQIGSEDASAAARKASCVGRSSWLPFESFWQRCAEVGQVAS
jgi:hypothetical protein